MRQSRQRRTVSVIPLSSRADTFATSKRVDDAGLVAPPKRGVECCLREEKAALDETDMRFKLRKMAFPSRCCEASSWSRRDLMHVVMMARQVPPPSTSLRLALRCPRQRRRACTSNKIECFRSYLPHALHPSMMLVNVRNGIAKREDSGTPELISNTINMSNSGKGRKPNAKTRSPPNVRAE